MVDNENEMKRINAFLDAIEPDDDLIKNDIAFVDELNRDQYQIKESEKSVRPLKILIESALYGRNYDIKSIISFGTIEKGYCITIYLPDNRKQSVYIIAGNKDFEGERIYRIYTICAPLSEDILETLLRKNMNLFYGTFAVNNISGTDYIVMVATQLVKTAQPEEIYKSIIELAVMGDELEYRLTGKDIM